LKSCWKGPLPPRRITPAATLADFFFPALCSSSSPRSPDPGSKRHPVPSRVQTPPAPVGPHPTRDPRLAATQPAAHPGHPRRRLVNPNLFISPTPYRDAVMAVARGRFRGRHGPGRGLLPCRDREAAPLIGFTPLSPAKGGDSGWRFCRPWGGSSCDRRAWRPWGAPPPATDVRGGRGGPLQLRPLAGVRLLGAVVMLTGRQANCSRVGAVGAPQLTRHQLTLPGGLLMMFKATRRESARIKKSWSVLSAPRTTTQTSVRNSAGQNRRWLSAVLQRMV
jgi:hypothetical protein